MKKLFYKKKSNIKRRISILTALAIVLTTVGTVTFTHNEEVQAKETLYSIEKIISDIAAKGVSYNVLEIVPDTVSADLVLSDLSGNETKNVTVRVEQSMGFMGYYVGGSEPLRSDVDAITGNEQLITYDGEEPYYSTLDKSSLRYDAINHIYEAVKQSEAYDEDNGPFSLANGYRELRLGERYNDGQADYEITEALMQEWMGRSVNAYGLIKRSADKSYVDTARGYMEKVNPGSDGAHYVLEYDYNYSMDDSTAAGEDREDIARNLMVSYNAFCDDPGDKTISVDMIYDENPYFTINCGSFIEDTNEREYGEFDPYLEYDSSDQRNVYAVFEDLWNGEQAGKISEGYRVDSAKPVSDFLDSSGTYDIKDGTPIYTFNSTTGKYEYAGDFRDLRDKLISSDEEARFDADSGMLVSVVSRETSPAYSNIDIVIEPQVLEGDETEDVVVDQFISDGYEDDHDVTVDNDTNTDEVLDTPEVAHDEDVVIVDDTVTVENDAAAENEDDNGEAEDNGSENMGVEGEYYIVTFKYVKDFSYSSVASNNDAFYGVKSFRFTTLDDGAQYAIPYSKRVLVPNLNRRGTITVKEECPKDYLVYSYYRENSKCNYIWYGNEKAQDNDQHPLFYRIRGAKIYYTYGIDNREWFKRYVFDRDAYPYDTGISQDNETASKLPVKVYTKLAQDVDETDITGKGDIKYDMIALMSGDPFMCVGSDDNYNEYRAKANDISSSVYVQILDKVSDEEIRLPIIVDHRIIENEEFLESECRDSLMYNLAYALTMEDVSNYSSKLYGQTRNIRSGELAGTVFSPITYIENNNESVITANYGDFVNKNIYMYGKTVGGSGINPINLLNLAFNEKFTDTIKDNGFAEVELDIANEKSYRAADYSLKDKPLTNDKVTEATVIRYIIGYGTKRVTEGKGEINVLELEPTACFDLAVQNDDITDQYVKGSAEYNKLVLKKDVVEVDELTGKTTILPVENIYEGEIYYKDKKDDLTARTIIKQKGLKINLTQMTTSEFVGRIEDLNSKYDLIYIGMNTGLTTVRYVVDEPRKRVYDYGPDGKTYWEYYEDDDIPEDREGFYWSGRYWAYTGNLNGHGQYMATFKDDDGIDHEQLLFYGNNSNRKPPKWHLDKYIYTIEKGHYEQTNGDDTYGGFHHRLSDDADVRAGRANQPNVPITDYNDDNMDGLVYCNVGDYAYITEAAGGSLKIDTGDTYTYTETDPDGNSELKEAKVYKWPEYVGNERYLNKDDERDHKETSSTHLKGYDYITITDDSAKGYSVDENGNRNNDNYSLYRSRYSGNDITKKNMNALIDFTRAGYPIILADDFYSSYDEGTRKGTINKCTVDDSSFMYEAISKINEESSDKNLFRQSYIPANIFNFYVLNVTKPSIEMTDQTCKIAQYSTVYLSDANKKDAGHYSASFKFRIDNKGTATANAKYNVGLYIDINADGKYSEKNEGIAFSSLKLYETQTPVTVTGIDEETRMPIYELEPDEEYVAECKLSGSFVGCLPWRITVTQKDNPYRRSNADGYYAIRNNDKEINILQVKSNNDSNEAWDMEADYNNHNRFYDLITDTAYMPFKVNIRSIKVSDFENLNDPKAKDGGGRLKYTKNAAGYYKYLQENYDMLILGFIDVYKGPNIEATKGIKQYIENGYSVLFTHDCTSFVNSYDRTAKLMNGGDDTRPLIADNWGYEFNSLIRNIVGMDRYDVMAESTHENEKPYKPRSGRKVVLDFESHGFTYLILNHWGYHAEKGNEKTAFQSNNNDGMSGSMLEYENYVGMPLGGGQYGNTNYVTSVNRGQVTQYPYVLKDQFPVVQTHSQYYQLDLTADDDKDGESDIVVWYCISKIENSSVNIYNISPNDVRNNYYIYNKGNVTYSGVGHRKPTGEDEFKLFINTMIAAYRTGLHEPDLAIVENYNYDASVARNLYVSYDDQIRSAIVAAGGSTADIDSNINKNSDIDNTTDMYFVADQVSLVQNASAIEHNLCAKVFISADDSDPSGVTLSSLISEAELPDGTCKVDGHTVAIKDLKVKEFPVLTGKTYPLEGRVFSKTRGDIPLGVISGRTDYTTTEGVEVKEAFMNGCVSINSGTTYKVTVPVDDDMLWGGISLSYNGVKQTRNVYVLVKDHATYKNTSNVIYKTADTKWSFASIPMSRVEVFNLD